MASTPTPEDAARRILEVFIDHGCSAGHVAQQNIFAMPFGEDGWRSADFTAGLEYAVNNGWVEAVTTSSFRLTDAGFAEA